MLNTYVKALLGIVAVYVITAIANLAVGKRKDDWFEPRWGSGIAGKRWASDSFSFGVPKSIEGWLMLLTTLLAIVLAVWLIVNL
ncbi:hypothetical protein JXB02_00680 [Candidatus Woesearchaeota archaeon]|nr:hypothetical protein [Candidatus Woesearchaeota archaeon]